jgi:5'-deoxynucleotidase YfbR-like HD superfamily hydrolase
MRDLLAFAARIDLDSMKHSSLFPFLTVVPTRLAHIRRCTNTPVAREENIQEHTFMVSLISYLIAEDMGADIGQTLSKALFHDIEEAVTGDITRNFKYCDEEFNKSLKNVLPAVMDKVVEDLPTDHLKTCVHDNWKYSKMDLEGTIVDVADSIAMLCFIYEETIYGNYWVMRETGEYSFQVANEKINRYNFKSDSLAARTVRAFECWYKEWELRDSHT